MATRRVQGTGIPVLGLRAAVTRGASTGAEFEGDVITVGTAADNDVVLKNEPTVSRYHLELRRIGAEVILKDRSTNGTRVGACLVQKQSLQIEADALLTLGASRLQLSDASLKMVAIGPTSFGRMLGNGPQIRRVFLDAARVATTDVPVLIQGESGTGKELLAEAIHETSPRTGALVTLDCGAIAPSLVASELFGHERGAFTGAERQHQGAFERADGGTLFLDELGELPETAQVMLLGALERGSFLRVGGTQTVTVDVRIVAATHRDLFSAVNEGAFRHDLFFRLAVVRLELPALRDRPGDLTMLLNAFFEQAGLEGGSSSFVDEEMKASLRAHHWPGNVRELRNWVQGSVALGRALPLYGQMSPPSAEDYGPLLELPFKGAKGEVVTRFEQQYLERLLERTGGNVRAAARLSELNRSTLIGLLKKHGIQ